MLNSSALWPLDVEKSINLNAAPRAPVRPTDRSPGLTSLHLNDNGSAVIHANLIFCPQPGNCTVASIKCLEVPRTSGDFDEYVGGLSTIFSICLKPFELRHIFFAIKRVG